MTCQCGGTIRFDVTWSGAVVESCVCGKRRALRGRTVEDIAREEAEFAASVSETPLFLAKPCAWPDGCDGMTGSHRTTLCAEHCQERRRMMDREYGRTYSAHYYANNKPRILDNQVQRRKAKRMSRLGPNSIRVV